MSVTSSLASVVMIAKVRIHSPDAGSFQFSYTGNTEWCTIFHGDCIRLFYFLALDGLPFEKAVDRHDAAAPAVSLSKRRQVLHGLAFGVDGFPAARRLIAPIRDQAPNAAGRATHLRSDDCGG